jgi:hypothetical protein
MGDDANETQREPSRQPDCLLSSDWPQIVPTPGTRNPVVFAVPLGAHRAGAAAHTEQPLFGDCLEHLEPKWLGVMQSEANMPRALQPQSCPTAFEDFTLRKPVPYWETVLKQLTSLHLTVTQPSNKLHDVTGSKGSPHNHKKACS